MEIMSPRTREKVGRWIGWAVFLIALAVGLLFLVDAISNINYLSYGDTDPVDAGYDNFTVAYVALRLGIAVACFLLALAVRPRTRYAPSKEQGS